MSDHDAAPDPIDKAYAQAEAVLSDERARAARRARVLAAVASEPAEPAAMWAPPIQQRAWRRRGWLVAASVAGLSALVALQIDRAAGIRHAPARPTAPAPVAPAGAPPAIVAAPTPQARTAAPEHAAGAPAVTPRAVATRSAPAPAAAASVAPPPALDLPPAPQASPAPAAAPTSAEAEDIVVSGSRVMSAPASAPSAQRLERSDRGSPTVQAERLRAAAAGGRVEEITALLAAGAAVDQPDADGETALMKAVQANRPAAAALLRRHGASLERKNRAGESARDMAAAAGDPQLKQALGLAP